MFLFYSFMFLTFYLKTFPWHLKVQWMSVVNQDMQALIQKSSGIETITPLKLKAKKHFEMIR